MKPWREVAVPHEDVLEGTFQQSEFAADISAVREGTATREYQDARAFFDRTYITEGMRLLLVQVARRLGGAGGEPVIQLQTAFGGGKTHTMLAVYHLAKRTSPIKDLAGVPEILEQAKIMDVPRANVGILDGTAHAPAQPWKRGKLAVHTLWGELAWQLGGAEAYEQVRAADTSGTSPGKEVLRDLLAKAAPCVILVDELVAYVRQFSDGQVLSGGTYDSNLSFIQALTEATKLVPSAVLLASLPESEIEAGSSRGVAVLRALEKTFGRVQALWKPVATEESFEIVRRRLFEPIADTVERDRVCHAFFDAYAREGAKLPSETHEARYLDRLAKAYPIHPEIFDHLYEDWSTLESFQRTRGVLKLMAHVIHELWTKGNKDLLILPGNLPLYRGKARDELLSHLAAGWDAVLDRDVDDDLAEPAAIDRQEPRFGAVHAARRVARATFFASAPSSSGATSKAVTRGVDRAHILLGCLQPDQSVSLYGDALSRLADRLHYLNVSGDKASDTTRFWFDTRANLRREMQDRKNRFDENEVRGKLGEVLGKLAGGRGLFDGVHVFTPHADVPDDGMLRLVVLDRTHAYSKQDPSASTDGALAYVRNNGAKPRFRANRLVFLAVDATAWGRLEDALRTALAWDSIVDDIQEGKLNVDRLQEQQARKESEIAGAVTQRATREGYRWLLCPVVETPTDSEMKVEAFPLHAATPLGDELLRVCDENEVVISSWSPVHLRAKLVDLYWKDKTAVRAIAVWDDFQKYLYLPRLRSRDVFAQAVQTGAAGSEFFGIAFGANGDRFEGFSLGDGAHAQLNDTLLLIEPKAADAYKKAQQREPAPTPTPGVDPVKGPASVPAPPCGPPPKAKSFFGSVDVSPGTAKMQLVTLADEVINVLASDPNATVRITVEISAEFPSGAPDHIKRAVAENAAQLKFKNKDWE